jgi:hypothetical protein
VSGISNLSFLAILVVFPTCLSQVDVALLFLLGATTKQNPSQKTGLHLRACLLTGPKAFKPPGAFPLDGGSIAYERQGDWLGNAQPIPHLLVMAAKAAIHASFNEWFDAVKH